MVKAGFTHHYTKYICFSKIGNVRKHGDDSFWKFPLYFLVMEIKISIVFPLDFSTLKAAVNSVLLSLLLCTDSCASLHRF